MRKFVKLLFLLLIVATGIFAWKILTPGTSFSKKVQTFIIEENETDKTAIIRVLQQAGIVSSPGIFSFLGTRLNIWQKIKPGKYQVKKGASLLDIARMLKNSRLAEYKLVINRIRTKEELARLISKHFKPDFASIMHFVHSNDSLARFGVDTGSLFTMIIPDTYIFYWNTSIPKIFSKLKETSHAFWQENNRLAMASTIHLTPEQVYTLASIVEEETNIDADKYKIASVYINRLNTNMALQACPTIKYAMKNFALTRIYEKYLSHPSPYNTYRYKGLPPGPICTPSQKSIDIVLDAPKTDYLFFVAKSDFSGYHHFSSNFAEHDRYASEYQKALDVYMARKQQKSRP